MTVIAVFSDANNIHLLSDSLVTHAAGDNIESSRGKWLSTGIFIDKEDQIRYKYSEGLLKIWTLQPNMAIGLAGDVSLATSGLEIITKRCIDTPFNSYLEFIEYFKDYVFSSITPLHGSFVLCGFIDCGEVATKFKISISPPSSLNIESTSDQTEIYCAGTGEKDFLDIWERMRTPLPKRLDVGPTLIFSILAEHLYMKQFLGIKELVTNRFTGGAITGVYCINGKMFWQPSRSIVGFANIGGTGFEADFRWVPIIYKTWSEGGNVFSSSMFEQNGRYYQRITQYSNPLSCPVKFSPDNLLPEMKTFNAEQISVILLPKGMSTEFPAVLRVSGKILAFDEISENGRIVGIRLNKKFFERLAEKFFVANDYTIKIGIDRLEPLIEELRRQLNCRSKESDIREWVRRQGKLAVRLMEYGGNTNNLELLSEALSRFLDAYETAKFNGVDLANDARHNLDQFVQDLKNNLNQQRLSIVIQKNKQAFEKYMSEKRLAGR